MVFVKSLEGKTVSVEANASTTIEQLKGMVLGTPSTGRIVHCGKNLKEESTLEENSLNETSFVNCTVPIKGGHCQVPCGIFDDPKYVQELRENAATIRKAMVQINEIHTKGGSSLDFNQMVRWVNTKEEHCSKIISSIAEYALCQRVKPKGVFKSEKDYIDALKAHHGCMQAAMKAKQQVALSFADDLEHAIEDCCKMYLK